MPVTDVIVTPSDWSQSHTQCLQLLLVTAVVLPVNDLHSQCLKSSLPVPEVGTPSAWRNCRGRTEREGVTESQAASSDSVLRAQSLQFLKPLTMPEGSTCAWMHSQCLKALPVPAMHRHLWGCTPCMRASLCLLEFTVHDGEPLVERHMCSPCLNGTGDPGAWSRAACLKKLPVPEDKAHARRRSPDSRSQVLPEVLPMPDWAPLTWVCPMSDGEPSAWWPSQCLKNTEAPLAWSRALCM